MNPAEPFNPFSSNAKDEYQNRRKLREEIAYPPLDDIGILKFDYCWTDCTLLGDKIRPVVIYDISVDRVFCAPISSSSEGEICIPAVSENRPDEHSWIHLNSSSWVPITKLKTKNGLIHREGRLPLNLAESPELNREFERIKQEISSDEHTFN